MGSVCHDAFREESDMAKESVKYERIKKIIPDHGAMHWEERRGAAFRFPIYMTREMESMDIGILDLSVRSYNCLKRANIMTIGDLCERIHCSTDLKQLRNCGLTSVAEIMDHLFDYQFKSLRTEKERATFLMAVLKMNGLCEEE